MGGSGGGDGEDSIDGDRLRSLSTTLVRTVSLIGDGLGDLSRSRSTVLVVVRILSTLGSRIRSLVSLSTILVLLNLSLSRCVSTDPDLSRISTLVRLNLSGLGDLSLSRSTTRVLVLTLSIGGGDGERSRSTTRSRVRTRSIEGDLSRGGERLTGLVNVSISRARNTSGCSSTGA
jgi:hypothetical protein